MTNRVTKSQITSAGISVEDFPARVAAHSEALWAWARDMIFVIAEGQHPPRKPETSDYRDPAEYASAVARYKDELSKVTIPYLPPSVPYIILWALNLNWLPDFEIVSDEPQSQKSEGGI
jgi:hypothetical protein